MGLPMAQNKSNEAVLGPDFVEAISLDVFIPFEVIWNCLDLWLCNIILISPSPWIFKVKFRNLCISIMEGRLTWNERDVSRCENVGPIVWLWTLTSPMILTLDFQGEILKLLYLGGCSRSLNTLFCIFQCSSSCTFLLKKQNHCLQHPSGKSYRVTYFVFIALC